MVSFTLEVSDMNKTEGINEKESDFDNNLLLTGENQRKIQISCCMDFVTLLTAPSLSPIINGGSGIKTLWVDFFKKRGEGYVDLRLKRKNQSQ